MNWDLTPLWVSLQTSACATALTFMAGIATAYAMVGVRGRWRALLDGIFTLPLVLPPTVVGFLLLVLFGRHNPLGAALKELGLMLVFSWPATVLTASVVAFPLMYRTALGAFEQINAELILAARTLGASEWRTFLRVVLPLAWPGVMAGTILSFTRALGEFGATLMVAGNIPGKTQTIPIAIYFLVEGGDNSGAMAWVLVVFSISVGTMLVANSLSLRSLGQLFEPPSAVEDPPHAPLIPTRRLQTTTPPRSLASTCALEVQAFKQLHGFTLDVQLATGARPVGLLGPSGAGKSFTLKTIAGIEKPDRGRIVLNGRVLFDSTRGVDVPARQRKIGYVFQDYALFPHLTVAENIGFGLHALPASASAQRVCDLVRMVQLDGMENHLPRQLSGGQKQRVALARALATQPDVLLLDEPFSALDQRLRDDLQSQLRTLLAAHHGCTILVTHDLEDAYSLCDELVLLSRGKVLSRSTPVEMFRAPPSVAVAHFTGCHNITRTRRLDQGTVEAVDWGCTLQMDLPDPLPQFLGIHPRDVVLTTASTGMNSFPCTVTWQVHKPRHVQVFVELQAATGTDDSLGLFAELSAEQWGRLASAPSPWHATVEVGRLLRMDE